MIILVHKWINISTNKNGENRLQSHGKTLIVKFFIVQKIVPYGQASKFCIYSF